VCRDERRRVALEPGVLRQPEVTTVSSVSTDMIAPAIVTPARISSLCGRRPSGQRPGSRVDDGYGPADGAGSIVGPGPDVVEERRQRGERLAGLAAPTARSRRATTVARDAVNEEDRRAPADVEPGPEPGDDRLESGR
jgi:hypothetical protein